MWVKEGGGGKGGSLLDGKVPLGVARVSSGFTGELVGPDDLVARVGRDGTGRSKGEETQEGSGSGSGREMHFGLMFSSSRYVSVFDSW